MKITITGASGFVGQNLVSYLRHNNVETHNVSLRNSEWITKIDSTADAIIHLAGKAHDTSNTSSEDEYFKINRDLTIEVFNKFLNSNIRDFFYFSEITYSKSLFLITSPTYVL